MYFNIGPVISDELEFWWATDPVKRWNETKIMHNAGATAEDKRLFFKGKYVNHTPFEDDLSFADKSKCSYKYAQVVKAVK